MSQPDADDLFAIDLKPRVELDEAFLELLNKRAAQERKWLGVQMMAWFFGAMFIAFVMGLFGISPYLLLATVACIGVIGGSLKATQVERAFKKRQYDEVCRLMPVAVQWNQLWSPITYLPLVQCLVVYMKLLMGEGRYLDYEALVRFSWLMNDGGAVTADGVPKNPIVANNLSLAFLGQQQYERGAQILESALADPKKNHVRGLMLNNLTICLIKTKRIAEAEKRFQETKAINSAKLATPLGLRVEILHAMLCIEKKEWELAERLVREAMPIGNQIGESVEFQAGCHFILAQSLQGQDRAEEADLAYRNSIDILTSSPNPPFLALAEHLSTYANFLRGLGKEKDAADIMVRAHDCTELSYQRDLRTIEALRARLADRKHILLGTELADSSRVRAISQDAN